MLDPMQASAQGRDLSVQVSGGQNPVTLRHVVVGDVFFFMRQRSVDVSLGRNEEGQQAARNFASSPLLRTLRINAIPEKHPQEDFGEKTIAHWQPVDSKSAGKMDAAAFYMARDLVKKIDVPIGIVDIVMGYFFGTSWLSETALDESAQRFGEDGDLAWFRLHMPEDQEKWEQAEAAGEPKTGLAPLERPHYPSACYNAVIHPLRGIAPKGILLQLGNDYPLVTYSVLRAASKITDRAELNYAWAQGYLIRKSVMDGCGMGLPIARTRS